MNETDFFNTDFMSDQEVSDAINEIINAVIDRVRADEQRTSILDPIKYKQIQVSYKALKYMTKGSGAVVSCKMHQPFNSMGYIAISGKNISFSHPEWFLKIAEYASNIEMYPKTNGTVQMNIAFHGLTTPIE